MRGVILGFDVKSSAGHISGDDGERYQFAGENWEVEESPPQRGDVVDFIVDGKSAKEIYVALTSKQVSEPTFYRLQKNAAMGGVCAGLAHKWGASTDGLRVATVIASIFLGL